MFSDFLDLVHRVHCMFMVQRERAKLLRLEEDEELPHNSSEIPPVLAGSRYLQRRSQPMPFTAPQFTEAPRTAEPLPHHTNRQPDSQQPARAPPLQGQQVIKLLKTFTLQACPPITPH